MTSYRRFKFRFLTLRYLKVAAAVYALTAFLTWLLIICLRVIFIEEYNLAMVLSIGLSVGAAFIFLYPWFQMYKERSWTNLAGGITAVCCFTMAFPAIWVSSCTLRLTGKLTTLASIYDITKQPPAQYYKVDHWYIDTSKRCIGRLSENVQYKGHSKRKLFLQVLVPVYNTVSDTASRAGSVWIGYSRDTEISAGLDKRTELEITTNFYREYLDHYHKMDLNRFTYLEREGNTDDFEKYASTLQLCNRSPQNVVILTPAYLPFEKRNEGILIETFLALIISSVIAMTVIILPAVDENKIPDHWIT